MFQRACHSCDHPRHLVQWHAGRVSIGKQAAQIKAVDEVHRDPQLPFVVASVVHTDDVRVPLISDPLPAFILMPEVNCANEELIWNRASQEWGLEGPMRDMVLNVEEAWRALFRWKPRAEVGWGFPNRYGLFSEPDRALAEFKLEANSATLVQLDRYLDALKLEHGGDWRGHIVWGNSCTRGLVEAVDGRSDVTLWRCDRTSDNKACLVRAA